MRTRTFYRQSSAISSLPVVAIIGRPNVGKSTIFNAMVGHRYAITAKTAGVTRDALYCAMRYGTKQFAVVDTGGIEHDSRDDMARIVTSRAEQVIRDADVALFVVEVGGLVGADMEIATSIRRYAERVICVVNKVDNPSREEQVDEFYRLGFKRVIAISATHRKNIDALKQAIDNVVNSRGILQDGSVQRNNEGIVDNDIQSDADSGRCIVSIIGRPNSGKSTLINCLSGRHIALVSAVAGTTRDTLRTEVTLKHDATDLSVRLIDTAGQRRRSNVDNNIEAYSALRAREAVASSDIVILVIDILEGLTTQDKKIAEQAITAGVGLIFAFNKIDLAQSTSQSVPKIVDYLRHAFPHLGFAPVIPISAQQGIGMEQLTACVHRIWGQLNTRIATGALNRFAHHIVSHARIGKHRLRYATQYSINPLEFVFFFNSINHIPAHLKGYIANSIRKEFNCNEAPLIIHFRERSGKK